MTEPVECAVGVCAGGRAPACSPRRYQPLRGCLLVCGVAWWPSSSSSGSASPFAMLAPPQARRSEPGGRRPRRGRRHGQQCFPCQGSRAESVAGQRFSAARQASENVAARRRPIRCVNLAKVGERRRVATGIRATALLAERASQYLVIVSPFFTEQLRVWPHVPPPFSGQHPRDRAVWMGSLFDAEFPVLGLCHFGTVWQGNSSSAAEGRPVVLSR